jgi:hypothetical protein
MFAITQGQYLDISFELQNDINLNSYWTMVRGKTAALITACTEIGALISQVGMAQRILSPIWAISDLPSRLLMISWVSGRSSDRR